MWRRFEQGGLLGNIFEVWADRADLRVRIGRGDRNLREYIRLQPSPEAARAELERLVAAHLAKGYVEVAPVTEGIAVAAQRRAEQATEAKERVDRAARERGEQAARDAVVARLAELERRRGKVEYCTNAELEAQCEATDDPAPWSVYADWLAERGDPRGHVATLHLRGDQAGANEMLELHRASLCRTEEPAQLTFRHGFARAVTFPPQLEDDPLAEAVAAILDAPIARFVDEVRTGLSDFGGENSWTATLAAIVKSPRASELRVLRFDNFAYDDCMLHWVAPGDLSQLSALPRLEALHVRSEPVEWGTLALPNLRTLVRESCRFTRAELAQLCAMPWPRLDHLELWFGSRYYGVDITLDDLAPLFDGAPFPKLGHLGLVNCDLLDELIPRLARSRLLPRLYSLDLSMGTLAREGTALLVEHARAFRHLAAIELAQNYLSPDDAGRITAVLDNVVIGPQRELDEEDEPEEGEEAEVQYRYVAEYE